MPNAPALAPAIIHQAWNDLLFCKVPPVDLTDFLTGKTEIARFWFQAANLTPLTDDKLRQLLKLRLRGGVR